MPDTGELVRSALKPISETYTSTAVDTNKDVIIEASVEPATEQEIADTVTVMGGQDWELWIKHWKSRMFLLKVTKQSRTATSVLN